VANLPGVGSHCGNSEPSRPSFSDTAHLSRQPIHHVLNGEIQISPLRKKITGRPLKSGRQLAAHLSLGLGGIRSGGVVHSHAAGDVRLHLGRCDSRTLVVA